MSSPLPPLPLVHTNSLKDQPLILSFSPYPWAIISLIIRNPSSARSSPSSWELGECVYTCVCMYVCVSLYLGTQGGVAASHKNCFPNCIKMTEKLHWLTFSWKQQPCKWAAGVCTGLSTGPRKRTTPVDNMPKLSYLKGYYGRLSTLVPVNDVTADNTSY